MLLLSITLILQAKQTYNNIIIDEIISIYDGDTFKVNINSYPNLIGKNISIRVNGIDSPELRTKCKKEKELSLLAKDLTISILKNAKVIELRNIQRGKYFRIIADVYADNINLANTLIQNKLAVKYNGGTKTKDWCK